MRLDNEKPERQHRGPPRPGRLGGFGFPRRRRGRGINIPMGGGRRRLQHSRPSSCWSSSISSSSSSSASILLQVLNGGGVQVPGGGTSTEITIPRRQHRCGRRRRSRRCHDRPGDATGDAGKDFVARVLGSTERVWDGSLHGRWARPIQKPKLVLFTGFVQSACGMAQSAMGPFYCPRDQKVYIDLSFYQDMKNKLGAPGDFAQAYVIAHEVGHHLQNLLGIADKVKPRPACSVSEEEGNALSVRMELQADCFCRHLGAGGQCHAKILEEGDIEEGLNAAAAIGDDRLQKRQGYVVPESFTHGTSEQRVRWFKTRLPGQDLGECDTFATDQL